MTAQGRVGCGVFGIFEGNKEQVFAEPVENAPEAVCVSSKEFAKELQDQNKAEEWLKPVQNVKTGSTSPLKLAC